MTRAALLRILCASCIALLLCACASAQRRAGDAFTWGISLAQILREVPADEDVERLLISVHCLGMKGIAPIPDFVGAQIVHAGEDSIAELVALQANPSREEWAKSNVWMRGRGLYSDCMGGWVELETSNAGVDDAGYCYRIGWDRDAEAAEFSVTERTPWHRAAVRSQVPARMTPAPVGDVDEPKCGFSLTLSLEQKRKRNFERCEQAKKTLGSWCRYVPGETE